MKDTLIVYDKPTRLKKTGLDNSRCVYEAMADLKDEDKEHFCLFCLDTRNKMISREILSMGNLNTAVIHPREIFRSAIMRSSNAIIVSHNHPSGDPNPSPDDIEITKALVKASRIMGIPLVDHVVVGCSGYVSMHERGLADFTINKKDGVDD